MEHIQIENHADTLYFSTIRHDCFCEHRVPRHTLIHVRSGTFLFDHPTGQIVVRAGEYIFMRRDCTATISKRSEGDTPFRSIALALSRNFLKDYFNRRVAVRTSAGAFAATNSALVADASRAAAGRSLFFVPASSLSVPALVLKPSAALAGWAQSLTAYADGGGAISPELLRLKQEEGLLALLACDERLCPVLFDFYETWKIDLVEFMESHFTEDLSLAEFAAYTGRSLASFKRDFAKISTRPPGRWINERRLDLARELLRKERLGAREVCFRVGFRNPSHFSTAYKRRFGHAPSAERNN